MRTFIDHSEDSRVLNSLCLNLVSSLFGPIKADETFVKIPAGVDIGSDRAAKDKIFVLKEGYLTYSLNGKKIFFYEQGDLVGLEHLYGHSRAQISSSFTTSVDVYSVERLFSILMSKPDLFNTWNELLIHQVKLMASIVSTAMEHQVHFSPDERSYKAGDVIINQGDEGHEIFALAAGHAEVLVDKVRVGEVLEGELFGVLAAMTNSTRTASVIATKECRVLSLHLDNFVELMHSKPSTVLKMVEAMARTISSLNQQVAKSSISEVENLRGG